MKDCSTLILRKEPAEQRAVRVQKFVTILAHLNPVREWELLVRPYKRQRTDRQNAYLWAVPIKLISDASGYEKQEVHDMLLGRHFGYRDKKVPKTPRNPDGIESVPRRTTTTDENGKRSLLNAQEFNDYVAFIQRFAAENLGLIIPDPDPLHGIEKWEREYEQRREKAA